MHLSVVITRLSAAKGNMITFLFPTRKMDKENLDDLCALRPRGLLKIEKTSDCKNETAMRDGALPVSKHDKGRPPVRRNFEHPSEGILNKTKKNSHFAQQFSHFA